MAWGDAGPLPVGDQQQLQQQRPALEQHLAGALGTSGALQARLLRGCGVPGVHARDQVNVLALCMAASQQQPQQQPQQQQQAWWWAPAAEQLELHHSSVSLPDLAGLAAAARALQATGAGAAVCSRLRVEAAARSCMLLAASTGNASVRDLPEQQQVQHGAGAPSHAPPTPHLPPAQLLQLLQALLPLPPPPLASIPTHLSPQAAEHGQRQGLDAWAQGLAGALGESGNPEPAAAGPLLALAAVASGLMERVGCGEAGLAAGGPLHAQGRDSGQQQAAHEAPRLGSSHGAQGHGLQALSAAAVAAAARALERSCAAGTGLGSSVLPEQQAHAGFLLFRFTAEVRSRQFPGTQQLPGGQHPLPRCTARPARADAPSFPCRPHPASSTRTSSQGTTPTCPLPSCKPLLTRCWCSCWPWRGARSTVAWAQSALPSCPP